jgi:hypothetical protein
VSHQGHRAGGTARDEGDAEHQFSAQCRLPPGALQITPLAEGIETREEMACLREPGISLMQGYLFARIGFETLPEVDFASL